MSFFSQNIYVSKYWGNYSLTLSSRLNHSVPSLDKMIDYYDDSDPLHIQIGNSSLKNSHRFDASTSLIYYGAKIMYSLEYNYTRLDNDIAYSSGVDQNGIMMTQPVNVDGNYYMDFKFNFNKPLDKNKKWNLDNKLLLAIDIVLT